MKDRRQYYRFAEAFPVRFKFIKRALGMSARSENVSEAGLRICGVQNIEPGTPLKLNFHLPEDKNPIMTIGEVMWQNEKRGAIGPSVMGIRFVDISPDDRDRIRDYIIHKISQGLNSSGVYEPA
jgi:hypothetical protein